MQIAIPSASLSPVTAPKCARAGRRAIFTFLYVCQYEQLFLKPDPDAANETTSFGIGMWPRCFWVEFEDINKYKEFEVSPHGEWVDLDIDHKSPKTQGGLQWNSGFKSAAKIDTAAKVWYAAMQIPWNSIDSRRAKDGLEMRANFYRIEAAPPNRILITWNPTQARSFHVPEQFGILRLVDKVKP